MTLPSFPASRRFLGPRRLFAWRAWLRRLLPFVFTAVIVWALLQLTGLHTIQQRLQTADWRWIGVGFGWYLGTNICRAYRFGTLLSWPGGKAPLRLLPEMIALSFLNNVLPARAGEWLFPALMYKRHRTPVSQCVALLLLARLFDFLAVSLLFLLFAFASRGQLTAVARPVVTAVAAVLGPALVLLAILPWLGKWGVHLVKEGLNRFGWGRRRGAGQMVSLAERVVTAVAQGHHIRTYCWALFWSLLGWLGTFAWFRAFLTAVHLPIPYPLVVVGATFATLAKALPFLTVGGFGAHDAGWGLGFRLVDQPLNLALAGGFAVNLLTLATSVLFVCLVAVPFMVFIRKSEPVPLLRWNPRHAAKSLGIYLTAIFLKEETNVSVRSSKTSHYLVQNPNNVDDCHDNGCVHDGHIDRFFARRPR